MIAIHRPEVAADFLRKLVVDNPSNLEALNALGVAYDLLGDHAAAAGTYRQALAMVPASNAVRNNLALSLALQENFAEAVQLLRPLAEGPGATRRSRQNLALIYGLQGDMASAERISRIDLGGEELTNNLAYFATVRGMENPAQRAAALAPEELPVMAEPRHTRKSRSVRNSAAPATGGTAVPEPFPAAPAPPPASQPRPLAPILGEAGGPGDGLGAWFVDVGRFDGPAAAERWRRLRLKHAADLAGMERLAGAGSGEEPLLIGAVDSEQAAAKLCGQLGRDVGTCQPMRL